MSFLNHKAVFYLQAKPVSLKRPATLVRAAQAGLPGWRRQRDLPRLLGRATAPAGPAALRMLRMIEDQADQARRAGRAEYDMHRHVRLLIALLAELQAQQDGPGQAMAPSGRGTAHPTRRA